MTLGSHLDRLYPWFSNHRFEKVRVVFVWGLWGEMYLHKLVFIFYISLMWSESSFFESGFST